MIRPAPLLGAVTLAACATSPAPLPPPPEVAEVRPVVAQDELKGRWTITAVNGQAVKNAWLELGAEGPAVEERRADGGINIGRPGAPSGASFGCNRIFINGWTRNGDKLVVGPAGRTEMLCDPRRMQWEEQGSRIIGLPLTMELTPPDRLRLINEAGTIDLVRKGVEK